MNELYKPYSPVLIKSDLKTKLDFNEALIIKGYDFIFWHMSEVKYFDDGGFAKEYYDENKEYILNIRMFNKTDEYHFWRTNGRLVGRHRVDKNDADNEQYAIDTEMVLRAVIANQVSIKTNGKLFIKTRNYIANEGFGYNDSRFVEITSK